MEGPRTVLVIHGFIERTGLPGGLTETEGIIIRHRLEQVLSWYGCVFSRDTVIQLLTGVDTIPDQTEVRKRTEEKERGPR